PIILSLLDGGADVRYHDPMLPVYRPTIREVGRVPKTGDMRSVPLDSALADDPDCLVIVTPHPTIDWDLLFERASLVVDTRNVSYGRKTRPGQVLRLGAGWS